MRNNASKRSMLQGKPALGIVSVSGSPLVAESLSLLGFDFVLVDNQHGSWDLNDTQAAFHSICLGNATPMARVQQNDFYAIGRLLDRGALGVVVPMVSSRQEAEAAAFAMHHPPKGGRSIGAFAADFYGASDYISWSDSTIEVKVPSTISKTVSVVVVTPAGKSNAKTFKVKPKITSISPTSGKVGSKLTINGSALGSTRGTSYVKFGSKKVSTYYSPWSNSKVMVKVPSGISGTVAVKLTTSGGTSNAKNFIVKK